MAKQRAADWAAETEASIDARLDAVKNAQTQTRLTLLAMGVISAMMLVAAYNAYFGYDYRYIRENHQREVGTGTIPKVLMDQAVRDWASSRIIQISVLGIRVSVDDAAVLGTLVLAILSLWLVLVTRRENHTIGALLQDTDTDPRHKRSRWLIFNTIAGNALFEMADAEESLEPIQDLDRERVPVQRTRLHAWMNQYGFRILRVFFFVFPVVTSVLVFAVDRGSYFIDDPFNVHGEAPGVEDPFFFWSQAAFFVFLVPLAAACKKANSFSLATEKLLREYRKRLEPALGEEPSAPAIRG